MEDLILELEEKNIVNYLGSYFILLNKGVLLNIL